MICVALCAGKGSRLGDLTTEVPKTLLEVETGKTILDTIFDGVSPHVDRIVIVAGYLSEVLMQAVGERTDLDVPVDLHIVDDVDRWNNARSLWSVLREMDDDVLVANGDTVVHPTATASLLAGAEGFDVALAMDGVKTLGEEEMKVLIDAGGNIEQISKLLDPSSAHGEYIGQSVISASAIEAVTSHLETAWQRDPQNYYEDGYQVAVDAGMSVGAVRLPDLPWTEVDDVIDLNVARSLTWL